jgi:hypothetical protein
LRQALNKTALRRGSLSVISQYQKIIADIQASPQMIGFWEKYREEFDYAKDITFDEACGTVTRIMDNLT